MPRRGERVGRDVTGMSVENLPTEVASGARDLCEATLWAGKPIASSSQLFGPPGQEIRYRVILLPLSESGGEVSSLFGVASHRLFELS